MHLTEIECILACSQSLKLRHERAVKTVLKSVHGKLRTVNKPQPRHKPITKALHSGRSPDAVSLACSILFKCGKELTEWLGKRDPVRSWSSPDGSKMMSALPIDYHALSKTWPLEVLGLTTILQQKILVTTVIGLPRKVLLPFYF